MMEPNIDIEVTDDGWYIVTLYVSDDLELHGTGSSISEALSELLEQTYDGGL